MFMPKSLTRLLHERKDLTSKHISFENIIYCVFYATKNFYFDPVSGSVTRLLNRILFLCIPNPCFLTQPDLIISIEHENLFVKKLLA